VWSLASPLNEGVLSLVGEVIELRLTLGGCVSTVKEIVLLWPSSLPSELDCVAYAV